jgi:hypothetical protein
MVLVAAWAAGIARPTATRDPVAAALSSATRRDLRIGNSFDG